MTDYKNYGRKHGALHNGRKAAKAIVLTVLVLWLYGFVGYLEQEPAAAETDAFLELYENIPARAVAKSGTQERIETLLPEDVARAIAERSDYPKTMAAIAHTESGGDRRAIGDGGRAKGLFQVWGSLHGDVPDDIEGQVDQANRLFLMMVHEHGYREAVKRWNGTPSNPKVKRYEQVVMAKVRGLEQAR